MLALLKVGPMQGSLLEPWYPMGSDSPQKARSYSKDIQKRE